MAEGGVCHPPLDMRRDREGRVHQHHRGCDGRIQIVVDLRRVVAADGGAWEQMAEQVCAGLSELVQRQDAAGEGGEDGEQPSAGGRFQHQVARRDRGGDAGREAERDRRRELLERRALLGAARMRGRQRGQLGQHGEHPRRAAGAGAHGRPMPAQEQDLRGLAGLVGVLPHPGAGRVGGAERRLHGGAQDGGIEGLAPLQRGQQQTGGVEDGGRPIGGSGRGRGCERGRPLGQRGDDEVSWRDSGERGSEAGGRSLDPTRLTPSRPSSSSCASPPSDRRPPRPPAAQHGGKRRPTVTTISRGDASTWVQCPPWLDCEL